MITAAYFGDPRQINRVYSAAQQAELRRWCRLVEPVIDLVNFDAHAGELAGVEAIFTTWGMPLLEARHLDRMARLRAVFFAAGSVKQFAPPLLERGIALVSAREANAIPTAQVAFALILLSMKGYFHNLREYRTPATIHSSYRGPGNFQEHVAVLGMGAIGRRVSQMLRDLELRVLAYDPYLTEERALALGVERVSLEEAFARAYVVSNHMPLLPETTGIIREPHLESMRTRATFINTARGAIVDEPGMLRVLARRLDLQALLDVSCPEPPAPESPLFALPNVCLSGHLAGAVHNELHRLAQCCIEEFHRWRRGETLKHAILPDEFACMA